MTRYLLMGTAAALLFFSILCRFFPGMRLKRLLGETANLSVSPNTILRQCVLKYSSLCELNGGRMNTSVYVEKFPNGNYKLLVSIADVSHYVKSGSALDKEAYLRGNSVYLVDRVIPMFPRELSNGLCSLNPNENKATFTCEMIFDENGKLIDHDVYKSVIKTAERMTYTNVNKVLAGDTEMTERYANVKDMFFTMLELSKILRDRKSVV